jgi:RNA polymerase sporulation-specific sigma factor
MHRVEAAEGKWIRPAGCDEELVMRAKRGRTSALEELLRRYRGLVESKARLYYLAGADHEDVIQEGMIGLFKAVRDFSAERRRGFRCFADLCVTRQIITAVKAASRRKHRALNTYLSMDAPVTNREVDGCLADVLEEGREVNPEELVLGRQLCADVKVRMCNELSRLEQQALRLYLEGQSYSEIAARLRCNVKQIDNALQRAKRKLSRGLWEQAAADRKFGAPLRGRS